MKETHRIFQSFRTLFALNNACMKSYLIFKTLNTSKKNVCTYLIKHFLNKKQNELLF